MKEKYVMQERGIHLTLLKETGLRLMPEPLLEFFAKGMGQILLIRGESGSGKSTLALSLLEDLLQEHFEFKNFIYVTTRTSRKLLAEQFVSFDEALLPDSIIDATQFVDEKKDDESVVVKDSNDLIKMVKKRLKKNRYPVIVIDSLEGLLERTDGELFSFITALHELAQSKKAKFVLVSESSRTVPIDHLMDGIIVLSMTEAEDYVWREIHFKKLRGVSIGSGSQPFTLDGNRFCKLWNTDIDEIRKIRTFKPKAHSTTRYHSGITGLDEMIGGFRLGSTCFLEVGEGVSNEIVNLFVVTLIANFVSQKGGVFMIPPNKLTYRSMKSASLRYNFIDHLNEGLRMMTFQFSDATIATENPETIEPYWNPVKTSKSADLEKQMDSLICELRDDGRTDILIVLGYGLLKSWLIGEDMPRWVMRSATQTAEDSGLGLSIGYSSTKEVNRVIADVADIHLTLSSKADATLIRGIYPRTSYYSIYSYEKDGGIHIGFQEVA